MIRSANRLRYLTGGILCTAAVFLLPCTGTAAQRTADLPVPARVVLANAGALIQAKAYPKAVDVLLAFQARGGQASTADQNDPKGYYHPEVFFVLGTCYLLQSSYDAAVTAYAQAVKRDPTYTAAWLNMARACYETHDYSRAARCFEQAYDHSEEKSPEHLYYCAAAYLMDRQNAPCLAAFEKLFDRHADAVQPAWRENYVHALLEAGRPKAALPHIRQLASEYTGEKQVQWQEILLHNYLQLDMQTEARTYALYLTRQAPTMSKWWKALTHVELNAGRYDQALVALTVYSYLTPLTAEENKLLADLNLQLGIPVKAAPLYEAVLHAKLDTRLLHNLMLALQQLGQPEEALNALQRFAPGSRDPGLLMCKADLLYSLERFDEAGQTYRQIARADTGKSQQTGRAWLMAGYAALQADDVDACRSAFRKAATFKKHRKDALLAIQRLPETQRKSAVKRPSS
jgi:tetratricopeptide (TPR) repeat protein